MILQHLGFKSLDVLVREWFTPLQDDVQDDIVFLKKYETHLKTTNKASEFAWYDPRRPEEEDAPGDADSSGTEEWARRLRRSKLWHLMVGPAHRGFFHACREARRTDPGLVRDWLVPDGFLSRILPDDEDHREVLMPSFCAHLLCAHEADLDEKSVPRIRREVMKRTGTLLPLGLIRDLAAEMTDVSRRRVERVATVGVILLDSQSTGITANLVLEVVTEGDGGFYPAPTMSLIYRDRDYRNGEQNARDYVERRLEFDRNAPRHDIRWHLDKRSRPLLSAIQGPSASAALGLLYSHLAAAMRLEPTGEDKAGQPATSPADADPLGRLDLSGVAISAEVEPDYLLGMIGGAREKALAARFEDQGLPRIHSILFAKGQRKEVEHGPPSLLSAEARLHDRFQVHYVDTLQEAAAWLAWNAWERWPKIVDQSAELDRLPPADGLDFEKAQVRSFLEARTGGYQLFRGRQFVGKSAFAGHVIRECGWPVAYHFIRSDRDDWDAPDTILGSLTDQLRRLFALPEADEDKGNTAAARFASVVQMTAKWLGDDQRAVLVLDGLDQAFGRGRRFEWALLRDLLPARLPDGIKVILTSRPGAHLREERCPRFDPFEIEPWRARAGPTGEGDGEGLISRTTNMMSHGRTLSEAIYALSIFSEPVPVAALHAVRPDLAWGSGLFAGPIQDNVINCFRFEGRDDPDCYVVNPVFRESVYRLIPEEGHHARAVLHRRTAFYYRDVAEHLARGRSLEKAPEWDADGQWFDTVNQLFDHFSAREPGTTSSTIIP